ncbi:MAG: RIP metalloprotease RseP [Gemmatimonadetes bacterium]|nr:RIP metalloprotease RseP [Gemmatimonadota bacterium]
MTILATIIVLGVLIFVHELGHFAAAKSVGVEVQRFSIGLGPRVWGFRRGETEYVLSAIPLGGYVKMGGMDDEVMERLEGGEMDGERTPSPRDFDSKPLWARAWVISAGVLMNMAFAFVAYTLAIGVWGAPEPRTTRVGSVAEALLPEGAEALAEIPSGAVVVSVGGRAVDTWGDVRRALISAEPGPLELELSQPGTRLVVGVPDEPEERARMASALRPWAEPVIEAVLPGSVAERGGLESGDRVVAVDGTDISSWDDFVQMIEARPDQRAEITVERDGRRLVRAVTPAGEPAENASTGEAREVGKIGVYPSVGEVSYREVDALTALQYGWSQTVGTTALIVGFLGDLVTGGVSARSVGSIVTIGEASGQAAAAGMSTFLSFMALFSVNLAVLNLLPIPVLDGGHLLFLAIEGVRGRALTVEQRLKWSNVGFLIVVGIMIWALSNDVLRLLGL